MTAYLYVNLREILFFIFWLIFILVLQNNSTSGTLLCIGEGNGNPLQCSCLENPMDRGACWVIAYGVAKSQT